MARPGTLCKLEKGKMIDAQVGFVDTFNWMVDFINNLRGDGDKIDITNPTGTNPVVRFVADKAESEEGGGIDLAVVDVDSGSPTSLEGVSNLTIQSAQDSHVTLSLGGGSDAATLSIGVHYAD